MKVRISQKAFSDGVGAVTKFVPKEAVRPILGGVLVTAKEGSVTLEAGDLTTAIRQTVPADVEEEGRTVLSGKVLAQMAKTLRDAPVSIETTDNGATLKCGRSRFKLMTLDPLDFPSFPAIDAQQSLTIGSDVAAELVKRVEGAASKDEHRPVLNGVHLTCDEENVTLVATDSYRLAVAAAPLPEGEAAAGLSATIPTDAIRNVILAASKADTVTFGIGEGLV